MQAVFSAGLVIHATACHPISEAVVEQVCITTSVRTKHGNLLIERSPVFHKAACPKYRCLLHSLRPPAGLLSTPHVAFRHAKPTVQMQAWRVFYGCISHIQHVNAAARHARGLRRTQAHHAGLQVKAEELSAAPVDLQLATNLLLLGLSLLERI